MWPVKVLNNKALTIKRQTMTQSIISPKDYQAGFQVAQREFEIFMQLTNRLKSIRAIQQLKNGELFLEAIGDYHQDMLMD